MKISQLRIGQGNGCEERTNVIRKRIYSDATYTDMYDWFTGENIANVIEN